MNVTVTTAIITLFVCFSLVVAKNKTAQQKVQDSSWSGNDPNQTGHRSVSECSKLVKCKRKLCAVL